MTRHGLRFFKGIVLLALFSLILAGGILYGIHRGSEKHQEELIDRWVMLHEMGESEVISLIGEGADAHSKLNRGDTPLHDVARRNWRNAAELLIDKGWDMDARNEDGVTPLHVAVQCGEDVAKLLIARGAKVNLSDKDGNTPLHQWDVSKEVTALLIAKGADVNAKGADVEAKDNTGNKASRLLEVKWKLTVVELLGRYRQEK